MRNRNELKVIEFDFSLRLFQRVSRGRNIFPGAENILRSFEWKFRKRKHAMHISLNLAIHISIHLETIVLNTWKMVPYDKTIFTAACTTHNNFRGRDQDEVRDIHKFHALRYFGNELKLQDT